MGGSFVKNPGLSSEESGIERPRDDVGPVPDWKEQTREQEQADEAGSIEDERDHTEDQPQAVCPVEEGTSPDMENWGEAGYGLDFSRSRGW